MNVPAKTLSAMTDVIEKLQGRVRELEADRDQQKRCRIEYQDIVYKACNLLDKTRTPCPDCTIDQVVPRIKDLQTEIGREYACDDKAEAENAKLREALEIALEHWKRWSTAMILTGHATPTAEEVDLYSKCKAALKEKP